MPDPVVETIYGKPHKYEIVRFSHIFTSDGFDVYRDGKYWRGEFSSLSVMRLKLRRKTAEIADVSPESNPEVSTHDRRSFR